MDVDTTFEQSCERLFGVFPTCKSGFPLNEMVGEFGRIMLLSMRSLICFHFEVKYFVAKK